MGWYRGRVRWRHLNDRGKMVLDGQPVREWFQLSSLSTWGREWDGGKNMYVCVLGGKEFVCPCVCPCVYVQKRGDTEAEWEKDCWCIHEKHHELSPCCRKQCVFRSGTMLYKSLRCPVITGLWLEKSVQVQHSQILPYKMFDEIPLTGSEINTHHTLHAGRFLIWCVVCKFWEPDFFAAKYGDACCRCCSAIPHRHRRQRWWGEAAVEVRMTKTQHYIFIATQQI